MATPNNMRNVVSFGHKGNESIEDDGLSEQSECSSVKKIEKNVMIYRENLQTAT
jgi:hypothetical protein